MAKKKTVAGTVADPVIQFAKLSIDGTEYQLAYDFNEIAVAEQLTGLNLLTGLINLWNDLTDPKLMGGAIIRGLLYAALRVAKPDTTIEDAGRLLRVDTVANVVDAIREAYALSVPSDIKKKDVDGDVVPEAA